ncbi:Zinc finger BED domain-containing protein 1 [Merluccius polli]|uniref:Zinc finger BED domain-containing protein 1 n=1 Tax=Merluccius polli TaxID=89951 RepID=A0AA47N2D3_MERPO|nr:Zinc finger BED domain-containing protein 1 [Merluccius polli]
MAESISPAPAAFRAEVWKYFGFHKGASGDIDRNLVVCRLCMAKVKYSGNTTNLRAHLARHHTEIQLALPEQQAKRDPSQLTLAQVQTQKLPATSTRATKITQSVVYFICKDMRPYSVVENEGFRSMVQTLEPRYVIPSRQYITDIAVPNLYKEVKTNVLECLGLAEKVGLTCDAWTSRATESYVTITVHHITDEWKLESCVLQTRAMYDSHTGENIAALLKEAVAEWQLDTKDPVLVTDNAANMHVAAELAGMSHIRCFAHSLNLASQKALKVPAVDRLLGRIRRVTAFFRRSTIASHQLKQKQDLLKLPKHKLITDVVTRWNSSYDMVDRFLEQQPAICAALLSTEVRRSEKDIFTLTEADITCAEAVIKALKPMKDATLVMSEESMPTVSIIAPLYAKLVRGTEEHLDDTQTIKSIKAAIATDLGKRYAGDEQDTLRMASALDPRFKDLPFLSEAEASDIYFRMTDAAVDHLTKQQNQGEVDSPMEETDRSEEVDQPNYEDGPVSTQSPSKRPRRSCALEDLLRSTFASTKSNTVPKSARYTATAEVKRFREEPPLPLPDNPLSWWKVHEHEYPVLSKVAKRFLCIPGTSVSSERVFSSAGDIVTAQRSVLKSEHVDQLVFLHKNLKIK